MKCKPDPATVSAAIGITLMIAIFIGYGLKTQCPGVADNVYIKCSK